VWKNASIVSSHCFFVGRTFLHNWCFYKNLQEWAFQRSGSLRKKYSKLKNGHKEGLEVVGKVKMLQCMKRGFLKGKYPTNWSSRRLQSTPVTSLGHQVWRKVFWEGSKYFKRCPIIFNYAQHIYPAGAKRFAGEAPTPTPPPQLSACCNPSGSCKVQEVW